jgi:carbamoyltransferase
MMQVFQIREDKRPLIPAVTHVDGSGRLQNRASADKSTLPPRHRSLSRSHGRAHGVEYLENEPVVCKPKEALDCFLRTKMDVLVMENTILVRRPG